MQQAPHHEQWNYCCAILNKLYFHGEMWQKKGKAKTDWQQSRVNIVADELRGCHQQGCDQSHVAANACVCASMCGCFPVFTFMESTCGTAVICAGEQSCHYNYKKDKKEKLQVTEVVWCGRKSFLDMLCSFSKATFKVCMTQQGVSVCREKIKTYICTTIHSSPFLWS